MQHGSLLLVSIAMLLSGCAAGLTHPAPKGLVSAPVEPAGWEAAITAPDEARLAALPDLWAKARASVSGRAKAQFEREGPLVDPAAALDLPALPPGQYSCRLVRLGGRAGFATFKPDLCTVDGSARSLSLTKQSGSILPGGWLFADTDRRQIFLGTLRSARMKSAPAYSTNPAQDAVGVVERVAPFRWRLVFARAGVGATLDIYELVPLTPRVPGS